MTNKINRNKKWLDFNARLDLISNTPATAIKDSVSKIRDWANANGFATTVDVAAQELCDRKRTYETQYGVRAGSKPVTFEGQRFYVMMSCPNILVLTYSYKSVRWLVDQMLLSGVNVAVWCPYKTPKTQKLVSAGHWNLLCDLEANPEWAKWQLELVANLKFVMDTPTPWLPYASLSHYAANFQNFDEFMDTLSEEIAEIEHQGVWDVTCGTTEVFNEKASVWSSVNHGKVSKGSEYKYATKKRFWYNYEQLSVDVMTQYLHLTYLRAMQWKPMERMLYNGKEYVPASAEAESEYCTVQYFEYLDSKDNEAGAYEQGLTVIPIYVDPYFKDDAEDIGGYYKTTYTPDYSGLTPVKVSEPRWIPVSRTVTTRTNTEDMFTSFSMADGTKVRHHSMKYSHKVYAGKDKETGRPIYKVVEEEARISTSQKINYKFIDAE